MGACVRASSLHPARPGQAGSAAACGPARARWCTQAALRTGNARLPAPSCPVRCGPVAGAELSPERCQDPPQPHHCGSVMHELRPCGCVCVCACVRRTHCMALVLLAWCTVGSAPTHQIGPHLAPSTHVRTAAALQAHVHALMTSAHCRHTPLPKALGRRRSMQRPYHHMHACMHASVGAASCSSACRPARTRAAVAGRPVTGMDESFRGARVRSLLARLTTQQQSALPPSAPLLRRLRLLKAQHVA